MTASVTPIQGMDKSLQQYHSITCMAGKPKIRMFACAMKQHLSKYHGFDVAFTYRWVRLEDGSLYFALSGSRPVQDVFADYLTNNNGDYYDSATVIQYGRNTAVFNRAFAKLLELKHGRGACGETK